MSKKVIVILAEGFEEIEAVTAIDILRRAEIEVMVMGLDEELVKGSRGITIKTDGQFDGAGLDADACVLPGGMPGAANLAASEKATGFIKKMNAEGKLIAAICASPAVVLSPTGILDGKSGTCYPGMQELFGEKVNFKEDSVVVDGNIITSRGVGTALLFSLAVVEKLCGKEVMAKVKKTTLAGAL